MKLIPTLIATFALIVGITTALPQTGGSGSDDDIPCPASQPCYNVSTVAEYCANNTDPAVLTGKPFDSTDPIECFCGSDVLEDETGFYAALECISCVNLDDLDSDTQALLALWIYTCYTDVEDGTEAALECWNSQGEEGCTPLPDSKAKKMKMKNKMKNKLIRMKSKMKMF